MRIVQFLPTQHQLALLHEAGVEPEVEGALLVVLGHPVAGGLEEDPGVIPQDGQLTSWNTRVSVLPLYTALRLILLPKCALNTVFPLPWSRLTQKSEPSPLPMYMHPVRLSSVILTGVDSGSSRPWFFTHS